MPRPLRLKENPRPIYLLSAIPFAASAADSLTTGAFLLGGLNVLGVVANLYAFFLYNRVPRAASEFFALFNALIAFVLSYHFFEAGKVGLPYAWIVAGLFNLVLAYVVHRKRKMA